jgi:CTD nuclear envelope phosphatase 1
MNSLGYISRRFDDVFVSPPPPPSTPTGEHPHRLYDVVASASSSGGGNGGGGVDELTIKRVKTWSKPLALALDAAVPGTSAKAPLRRTLSNPSNNHSHNDDKPNNAKVNNANMNANVIFPIPSSKSKPSSPSRRSRSRAGSLVGLPEHHSHHGPSSSSIVRRIFLARILVHAWNSLRDIWAVWTSMFKGQRASAPKIQLMMETGTTTDEKDSTDEESNFSEDKEKAHFVLRDLSSSISVHMYPSNDSNMPTKPPIDRSSSEPSNPGATTAATPATTPPPARRPPTFQPKTLVLDLDETLIHSTTRPMTHLRSPRSGLLSLIGLDDKNQNKGAGHMVEVVLNGRSTLYHVYKRPFVDYFLRKVVFSTYLK